MTATDPLRSFDQEGFLAANRSLNCKVSLLALCVFGCSPHDGNESSAEEVANKLDSDFATIQFAIEKATCGELAFRFDVPLSEKLLASSFDSYVAYFESLEERHLGIVDQDNVFGSTRERAAAALGRVLGETSERLTQDLRDQGGGDAIAAARNKYQEMGCPS